MSNPVEGAGATVTDSHSTRVSSQMCGLGRCIAWQSPDGTPLKACSACNTVFYCCKDHQVEHYKKEGHKIVCRGRKEGKPPTFNEMAEAAQKYTGSKSHRLALMNWGGMLELTEQTLDNTFHPQCSQILEQMAMCYKALDEVPSAVGAYSRSLLIRDFNNDNNDPQKCKEAFTVMGQWAECFITLGQLELARDAFKKIEQAAIEYFGADSLQRGQAFISLGTIYTELGQWKEAEVTFKLALSLEQLGKSSDKAALLLASRCQHNHGVLLSAMGRHSEASAAFKDVVSMRSKAGVPADDASLADGKRFAELAEKGQTVPGAPTSVPAAAPAEVAAT